MHHERRAVLESREAAFERLQPPGLRRFRIAQQHRIVELNDLASGRDQRRDFMMNRVGVVEGKSLSIALIVFIGHAVGNGARPRKPYLGDALGMLPGEQELIQNHRPHVLYLADDPRRVLLRRSAAHGDAFPVAGVDASQLVDDVQHIVAAPFFAVGHDVDARAVLVFDRLKRGPVQQSCEFGRSRAPFGADRRKSQSYRATTDRFA